MIKAVIFDFGQTLVDSSEGFRSAEKEAQEAIFNHMSLSDHDQFKKSYRNIRSQFHQEGNLSRINIWKAVYEEFSKEPPITELLAWEVTYWQTVERKTSVFPEVPYTLKFLSAHYEHLALVTNTQGQTTSQAHRFTGFPDLAAFFSVVVVAGQNGVPAKPDALAFNTCLKQLGITPDEAIYIGDDWLNDIIGSREAGLLPVWLKHSSVKRNYPEVKDDVFTITKLTELIPFLEDLEK